MAFTAIRDQILSGALAVGEILSEQALAAELGISRTPVREALSRLNDLGLVRITRGRGAVIEGLGARELTEIFELREAIEVFAASRAPVGTNDHIALRRLDAVFGHYGRSIEVEQVKPVTWSVLSAADEALHRALVKRSNNQLLLAQHERLALRLVQIRSFSWSSLDRVRRACEQHHTIVGAALAGDPEILVELIRDHLREGLSHLLDLLACPPPAQPARPIATSTDAFDRWLMEPCEGEPDLDRLVLLVGADRSVPIRA